MGFDNLISEFEGLPVRAFDREDLPNSLAGSAWRISIDWDAYESGRKFVDDFATLLSVPGASELEGLIIGGWDGSAEGGSSESVIESLVAAREQLPNLKHLFIGEMLQDDCEVSWIVQSDLSPVFLAFPNLETLRIRGTSSGLSLGRPNHSKLKHLIVEGGGMPATVVAEIASANLPALQHLELWLGSDGYGNDIDQDDLQPILDGELFPELKYLGLRNDGATDTTVQWLREARIVEQLNTLDLSLGTLTDSGAKTLCEIPALAVLKRLDVFHHFMSGDAVAQLKATFPSVAIDANDAQEEDRYENEVYRYNFVSE